MLFFSIKWDRFICECIKCHEKFKVAVCLCASMSRCLPYVCLSLSISVSVCLSVSLSLSFSFSIRVKIKVYVTSRLQNTQMYNPYNLYFTHRCTSYCVILALKYKKCVELWLFFYHLHIFVILIIWHKNKTEAKHFFI